MDEKRKGEIALAVLKYLLVQEEVLSMPVRKREVGTIANETGIPLEELKEFVEVLNDELIKEALGM